jgi:hypothetical protein
VRSGEDLEDLTEKIFRILTANPFETGLVTVEKNVCLPGADGPRQIDVVVRTMAGPIDLMTIIECKDYRRKVDVTTVDALHSVAQDVKANRAVLVARSGFSRTARQKANRLGIALFRADRMMNVTDEVFQVPVYVHEIRPTEIEIGGHVRLDAGDQVGLADVLTVNDQNLLVLLRKHLVADETFAGAGPGRHEWSPTDLGEPMHIGIAAGETRVVEELSVTYMLAERHFFGYLSDLRQAILLYDEFQETSQVLVEAEMFVVDYARFFAEFSSRDELPLEPVIMANVAMVPDPDTDVRLDRGRFAMRRISP